MSIEEIGLFLFSSRIFFISFTRICLAQALLIQKILFPVFINVLSFEVNNDRIDFVIPYSENF